jgi:hypothetical protein
MNRSMDSRKVSFAPIKVHNETGRDRLDRILKELDQAETMISAEKERIGKRRDSEQTKYNIAVNLGDRTTLGTKLGHAFCSIIADWTYKNEGPKMLHALYLIRKLKAAINGGLLLREESDVELAFVRQVVRGITS